VQVLHCCLIGIDQSASVKNYAAKGWRILWNLVDKEKAKKYAILAFF
jgi:hypothetical protein